MERTEAMKQFEKLFGAKAEDLFTAADTLYIQEHLSDTKALSLHSVLRSFVTALMMPSFFLWLKSSSAATG